MRCPLCKSELEERPRSFTCPQCGFVLWREIAGKRLTTAEMEELVTNGRTPVLHGFRNKQGKEFMASLVVSVDNKKVILEFPKREVNGSKRKRDVPDVLVQKVRVETYKSGTVRLTLEGPVQFSGSVSFGVVPARFAECHGLIAAAKLIKHYLQDLSHVHLQISANSRAFVEYVLKEKIPAHLEDRSLMEHLWQVLGEYRTWQIACEPRKSVLLKGGPHQSAFPGAFSRGLTQKSSRQTKRSS